MEDIADLAETELNVSQQAGLQAVKVEMALRKEMNQNNTGICEGCKIEIDPSRLEVIPGARFCLKCQNEADRRIKSYTKPRYYAHQRESQFKSESPTPDTGK